MLQDVIIFSSLLKGALVTVYTLVNHFHFHLLIFLINFHFPLFNVLLGITIILQIITGIFLGFIML